MCKKKESIKNSHIMPDFITRWLRDTSVTQRMRSSLIPNKRIQDTSKVSLLCKECEGLFGKFETYFSEIIFKPVIDSDTPVLNYDARLLKFGVSLVWCYLVVSLPKFLRQHPTQKVSAEIAERKWRDFLFDDLNLNGYEIHLLMLNRVIGAPIIEGTDLDINWYFFRTVGGTVCLSFQDPFVLIKLPAFVFIAPLKPVPFTHMTGTRIHKEGIFEFNKQAPNGKILDLFLDYAEEALSPLGTISK